MKTIIEFMRDPQTGSRPVLDLIQQIGREARTNTDSLQLYKLIVRGLEYVEVHGVQAASTKHFVTAREDGIPYTIMLVKMLERHTPLLEFRVNWKQTGAFRAVFFTHWMDNQQLLIMARAALKQKTYDPEFERIVRTAARDYHLFRSDPEQYIFDVEAEKHDT